MTTVRVCVCVCVGVCGCVCVCVCVCVYVFCGVNNRAEILEAVSRINRLEATQMTDMGQQEDGLLVIRLKKRIRLSYRYLTETADSELDFGT